MSLSSLITPTRPCGTEVESADMVERVKLRRDFLAAAKGNKQVRGGFVLQTRARGDGSNSARDGYTVTKKVGNAVVRNRIKRRLREAVRINQDKLIGGLDYIFIGRRNALTLPYSIISDDVKEAVDSAHHAIRPDARPKSKNMVKEPI